MRPNIFSCRIYYIFVAYATILVAVSSPADSALGSTAQLGVAIMKLAPATCSDISYECNQSEPVHAG